MVGRKDGSNGLQDVGDGFRLLGQVSGTMGPTGRLSHGPLPFDLCLSMPTPVHACVSVFVIGMSHVARID